MYTEDQLLPVSGLQHLLFCERQCALIHVEGLWAENALTVEGRILHERTHDAGAATRGDLRVARGLPLRSLELGLAGVADVVEFQKVDRAHASSPECCALPGARGWWKPFPVEYKRGKPKRNNCDAVQLCAQALCLEEMLGVEITAGALFYGATRRRVDVQLDAALRAETADAARRLHELIDTGVTPKADVGRWCRKCSLAAECMPGSAGSAKSARRYLKAALNKAGNLDVK